MIANLVTHVILGGCTQTGRMAELLEVGGAKKIAVIDYEAKVKEFKVANVHIYSSGTAKREVESSGVL